MLQRIAVTGWKETVKSSRNCCSLRWVYQVNILTFFFLSFSLLNLIVAPNMTEIQQTTKLTSFWVYSF